MTPTRRIPGPLLDILADDGPGDSTVGIFTISGQGRSTLSRIKAWSRFLRTDAGHGCQPGKNQQHDNAGH